MSLCASSIISQTRTSLSVVFRLAIAKLILTKTPSSQLKHTYLRVLYPLLTNTQLKDNPYKPNLLHHTLQNFISHAHIRDVDATTRRLVDRCLSGDWCKNISLPTPPNSITMDSDEGEFIPPPSSEANLKISSSHSTAAPPSVGLARQRSLQRSASAEMLRQVARPDARKTNGKDSTHTVFMAGPTSFSPLTRQLSIKSKRGQGLTAHMASLSIVPQTDSQDSLASVTGAHDVQTLNVPARDASSGMLSPGPLSPTNSPPPGSDVENDTGKAEKKDPEKLVHTQSHHYPNPSHDRVARPIRSRSADPATSPALEHPPRIPSPITQLPTVSVVPVSPIIPTPPSTSTSASYNSTPFSRTRTKSPPPPPPPRRRKPPAPPVAITQGSGKETIHTIASSSPSLFSPPLRSSPLNPSTLASLRAKKPRNGTSNTQ